MVGLELVVALAMFNTSNESEILMSHLAVVVQYLGKYIRDEVVS